MPVADILPPEDKRRYSQTSPEAQKALRNLENSRVNQSRIKESGRSPTSANSPSRYRQLQANLRAKRNGGNPPPLPGPSRRYGQNQQTTSQPSSKQEGSLSKITIIVMLVVSVIIDICQIALNLVGVGEFINDICDIPIELGFYIWFKIEGVNFGSTRKMLAFLGTFAFGLGTDSVIPSWTLEIALMIAAIKAEDKLANISPIAKAVVSKASGGV